MRNWVKSVARLARLARLARAPVRSGFSRENGISLVELLVVLAVVGVILAGVAVFFAQQTRVSRDQQARSELQTTARYIGDLIAQDFQLVGSRAAASTDGAGVAANAIASMSLVEASAESPDLACVLSIGSPSAAKACINVDIASPIVVDDPDVAGVVPFSAWSMYYMSSLWLTEAMELGPNLDEQLQLACRRVQYRFLDGDDGLGIILRSDQPCLEAEDLAPAAGDDVFGYEVASGVRLVNIAFGCAADELEGVDELGVVVEDPDECIERGSFARSATISVLLRSVRDPRITLRYDIAAPTPNLRPPVSFITGDPLEVGQ